MTTNKPGVVTDEMVEAVQRIRETAMRQTVVARIPECGEFGGIAQDADWLLYALKALQAECEKLRKDAERYRWLLQECYRWPPAGRVCGREDQAQPVAIWTTFEGDDVDAAIDATIAQRGEV